MTGCVGAATSSIGSEVDIANAWRLAVLQETKIAIEKFCHSVESSGENSPYVAFARGYLEVGKEHPDLELARGQFASVTKREQPESVILLSMLGVAQCHAQEQDQQATISACHAGLNFRDRILEHPAENYERKLIERLGEKVVGRFLILRGNAYRILGKYELALDDLRRTVALFPENARVHRLCALTNEKLNHFMEALADWNQVVDLEPLNPGSWTGRGTFFFYKINNRKDALSDFGKAIELGTENPHVYALRGMMFLKIGAVNNSKTMLAAGLADIDASLSMNSSTTDVKDLYHLKAVVNWELGNYRASVENRLLYAWYAGYWKWGGGAVLMMFVVLGVWRKRRKSH